MTLSGDERPPESALRRARVRAGWTQAAAMRRFEDAVRNLGERAPTGASLKRMFAYWESGERAVTVEAYRKAFVTIYQAPYEALGFAPNDATGRIAAIRDGLELYDVDHGLVSLFESQTQNLRMLDRRLGTAALVQQTVCPSPRTGQDRYRNGESLRLTPPTDRLRVLLPAAEG